MIDCYCKVCGLYINTPDEYAGGRGTCPRCRTRLRIPVPIKPDSPRHKTQLRYIAYLAADPYDQETQPILCDDSFGPSDQYRCTECEEFYESITIAPQTPHQCPSCKTENQPAAPNVKFPRNYADENDTQPAPVCETTDQPDITDDKPAENYVDEIYAEPVPSCQMADELDIPFAMPAEDCDDDDEDIPYALPVYNSSLGDFKGGR